MPLKPNAVLTFQSDYEIRRDGVKLHFICADPGGGEPSDYYVELTDAEVASITDLASAQSLILNKLRRAYRRDGIASKLDQLVGRSITLP